MCTCDVLYGVEHKGVSSLGCTVGMLSWYGEELKAVETTKRRYIWCDGGNGEESGLVDFSNP